MYYLIQKNVFQDHRYDEIFQVMESLGLSYEEVQFRPKSNHFDFKTDRTDIFVYGSVKLAKEATKYSWNPGSYYGGNHVYEKYAEGYQQHLLNAGSITCAVEDTVSWKNHDRLFIKPSQDAKVFTGKVFKENEWNDFVYQTLHKSVDTPVLPSTPIQVAPAHHLIKEARIWIVDQKIVTSSYYFFHGDVPFEATVDEEGLSFAGEMAQLFDVAKAYVLDICLTFEGWKVVEVNCINSAGFYNADVRAIILALENAYL